MYDYVSVCPMKYVQYQATYSVCNLLMYSHKNTCE
jgi:hypothetical protein